MAASSEPVSDRRGEGKDGAAAVVADRVSKLYPGRPAVMFPPVLSIFQRDLFRRKRSRNGADGGLKLRTRDDGEDDVIEDDDDLDDGAFSDYAPPPRPTRARPNEDFWALKDVSFNVPPGGALGVLGPPDSGKTTLMAILGGHAFPTEGRVMVRDPVSPLPERLARGLRVAEKGTFDFDLVFGSRMIGLPRNATKPLLKEIEALAAPLIDDEGEPVRGWASRLAIATSVLVPGNVLLLEEEPVMDPEFTARLVERVHARLRSGTAAVIASRTPGLLRELCQEIVVLDEGQVVESGAAPGVLRRLAGASANGPPPRVKARKPASAPATIWQGRPVALPAIVTPFNDRVALLSAKLRPMSGARLKRVHSSEELLVEIAFECAVEGVEAHFAVDFIPSDPGETRIRFDSGEPLALTEAAAHRIAARIPPGVLPADVYAVRTDAVVWNPQQPEGSIVVRDTGRIRIVGEGLGDPVLPGDHVDHWDGLRCRTITVSWSID